MMIAATNPTPCGKRRSARMVMHMLALAALTFGITACGGGGDSGDDDSGARKTPAGIAGSYRLASVNGRTVPTPIFTMDSMGVAQYMLSGGLEITGSGSTYESHFLQGTYLNGQKVSEQPYDAKGVWELSGENVQFHDKPGTGPGPGKMTIAADGSLSRTYAVMPPPPYAGPAISVTEVWRR